MSRRAILQLLKTGILTFKSCLERLNHPDIIKFQNLRKKVGEEEVYFHFSITEKPERQGGPFSSFRGVLLIHCYVTNHLKSLWLKTTIITLLLSLTALGVGWAQPGGCH